MLPATFSLSQSSLQDYVDCARRFQLRYIQSQAWPAVLAEPLVEHEHQLERGERFHRLVQRHQLGMEATVLSAAIGGDPDLRAWWQAYLGFAYLHTLGGKRYPEYTLSTSVAGVRLTATYDLLVVTADGRVVIFDWKTYRRKPSRAWFEKRLQTRVYPYVVARAGAGLLGGAFSPDLVSMVYWVASGPGGSIQFRYDGGQFLRDEGYLSALVEEFEAASGVELWKKTSDDARCRFCEYRSLCDRGIVAGSAVELSNAVENIDVESGWALGLEDVEEVGF
jgi:hypothetical protein